MRTLSEHSKINAITNKRAIEILQQVKSCDVETQDAINLAIEALHKTDDCDCHRPHKHHHHGIGFWSIVHIGLHIGLHLILHLIFEVILNTSLH